MAGRWSLLHAPHVPGVGPANPPLHGELAYATNLSYGVDLLAGSTLSFDMPGNLRQTAAIVPRVSDVLAVRDGDVLQRFRVVGRQMRESGGAWTASFSCVDYRALLKSWILHPTDQRTWRTATDQVDLAWGVIYEGAQKPYAGFDRLIPGVRIGASVLRVLDKVDGGEHYPVGKPRYEVVDEIAQLSHGFLWDIEPPRSTTLAGEDPLNTLLFNTWQSDGAGRSQFAGTDTEMSPVALDSPGSWFDVSHTVASESFANVVYFSGGGDTAAASAVWYPSSQNPADTGEEGRWERSLSNSDTSGDAVGASAEGAFHTAHDAPAEVSGSLAHGRWPGRDALWVGDQVRVQVSVPMVDMVDGLPKPVVPAQLALGVNEGATVSAMSIAVDANGVESVGITVGRRLRPRIAKLSELDDRLQTLERPR